MSDVCERCEKAGEDCGPKVLTSEPHDPLQNVSAESTRDPDEVLQLVNAIIQLQKAHPISAEARHNTSECILELVVATFRIQETNPTMKPKQIAQNLRNISPIDWSGMTWDTNDTKNTQELKENGDEEKDKIRLMEEISRPKSACSVVEPLPQYEERLLNEIPTIERFRNTGHSSQSLTLQQYQTPGYHEYAKMDTTSMQPTHPVDGYMNSLDPTLGSSASTMQYMNSPHNPPTARLRSDVSYPRHAYNLRVIHHVNAAEAIQMAVNEGTAGFSLPSTSNNGWFNGPSHDGSTTYPPINTDNVQSFSFLY
jgi:hypothetical protein